jgi:hypothetical protein
MAHISLSELPDWHLVHTNQDIRGWNVVDAAGDVAGRVAELLVDTDRELVEAIRLEDGTEFSADDIEIGDQVVYLREHHLPANMEQAEPIAHSYRPSIRLRDPHILGSGTSGVSHEPGTLGNSAPDAGMGHTMAGMDGLFSHDTPSASSMAAFNDVHTVFHEHYLSQFGETGQDYEFYEPAYVYGYDAPLREEYRGRDWNTVEPELRTEYERRHGAGTWTHVRNAVRHGFDRGRNPQ